MAAHNKRTQSNDPSVPAWPVSTTLAPMQDSGTDLAVRAATGRPQRPPSGSHDGIRAAASVMGWVLWLLLAFITAAFLTFAPWLL